MRNNRWLSTLILLGVIAVMVLAVPMAWDIIGRDKPEGTTEVAAEEDKAVPTWDDIKGGSKTELAKNRPVMFDPNRNGRQVSTGVPKSIQDNVAKATRFLLRHAAKDPRTLQTYYNITFTDSRVNLRDLYRKGYLTKFGAAVFERLAKRWNQAVDNGWVKIGVAPKSACNTFTNPGSTAYQECGRISGNRLGLKFKFPGKDPFWIMFRCANAVSIGRIPKIPPTPVQLKCPNGGATAPGLSPCGTDRSGPEQNLRTDPGRTDGYVRGNAEEVVRNQPVSDDIDTNCGRYGCNSGGGRAPGGRTTGPGDTETGTDEGTDNPEDTEGSDDDTNVGDPGPP